MIKFFILHKVFILYVICVLIAISFGYWYLPHAYFANDEWLYISGIKTDGLYFLLDKLTWFEIASGVRRPLGTLLGNYFYSSYPFNPFPFISVGILIHFMNGIVLWFLVKRISKNELTAFVSGLFFICSSVYVQSIAWLACSLEVPISTFFTLLSIYTLFLYVEKRVKRWLLLTLIFAYISFLFKDIYIFLFVVLPLVLFVYEMKKRKFTFFYYIVNAILLLFFIVIRVFSNVSITSSLAPTGLYSLSVSLRDNAQIMRLLYRVVAYPFIGLVQIIFPTRLLTKIMGIFPIPPDVFLLLLSFLVCLTMFFIVRLKKQIYKNFSVIVLLYVLSFIPIAIYLTDRGSAFIESRYMYFPTIMVSIITAYVLIILLDLIKRYVAPFDKIMMVIIIGCGVLYLYKQVMVTQSDVFWGTKAQQDIKNTYTQLSAYTPLIPDNPIFYVTSDFDYFWPNNKLPFQEGTGLMLMITYMSTGKISYQLVREQYLAGFGTEGYQEREGKGFGFFFDKEALVNLYKNHPELKVDQIIGFEYVSRTKTIQPNTKEIKEYLQKRLKGS